MATPLGRLPVWRRQSTRSAAAFRMSSWPVAGSASLARNTWLPPRLTIRNVSPARLASMATMSFANVLSRLGGGAAVSTAIWTFRFLLLSPTATSARASVSITYTSACTFALKISGGSGWGPMAVTYSRLPRITADRSWFAYTPCLLTALTGSVPGRVGSGQKMFDWGWTPMAFGQKFVRLAEKPESGSGARVILVIGGLLLPA